MMEHRRDLRDKRGVTPKDQPVRGSYAETRLHELKKERDKYNVNYFDYYKGGLPQKDRGAMRGKALGNPGELHQPQVHNWLEFGHPDATFVTPEDALKFKHWHATDKYDFERTKPWYPNYYDTDFDFLRDRIFWMVIHNLFILLEPLTGDGRSGVHG